MTYQIITDNGQPLDKSKGSLFIGYADEIGISLLGQSYDIVSLECKMLPMDKEERRYLLPPASLFKAYSHMAPVPNDMDKYISGIEELSRDARMPDLSIYVHAGYSDPSCLVEVAKLKFD